MSKIHPSVQQVISESANVQEGRMQERRRAEMDGLGGAESLGSVGLDQLEDAVAKASEIDVMLDKASSRASGALVRELRRIAVLAEELKQELKAMESQHHTWRKYRQGREDSSHALSRGKGRSDERQGRSDEARVRMQNASARQSERIR